MTPAMSHYLVTFHETDGNDATVFDAIVEAADEQGAFCKVSDAIEADLTERGTSFETDGDCGVYFQCEEDCPEECDGHGGIAMRTAEPFETLEAAEKAQKAAYFHSRYEVSK